MTYPMMRAKKPIGISIIRSTVLEKTVKRYVNMGTKTTINFVMSFIGKYEK
ncbi:MAG: hypothetical protein JRN20_06920 [Nitrososphaerota archaeon]|nr:hypothetical protein [Nitrososphaerota archaeon]